MDNVISNQAYLFAIFSICGATIGIFFDIFRILRKSFKTSDFVTYIEDIVFGIVTGIFLVFMIFIFNNGQLRFFIFLALLLGLTIYLLTVSKLFIKFSVAIIVTIKKIILKTLSIILYPFKKVVEFLKNTILKLILKPFKILTIDVKHIGRLPKLKDKFSKKKKEVQTDKESTKKQKKRRLHFSKEKSMQN